MNTTPAHAGQKQRTELRFIKSLPDKSVEAAHIWPTGYQVLVFSSLDAFHRAKALLS